MRQLPCPEYRGAGGGKRKGPGGLDCRMWKERKSFEKKVSSVGRARYTFKRLPRPRHVRRPAPTLFRTPASALLLPASPMRRCPMPDSPTPKPSTSGHDRPVFVTRTACPNCGRGPAIVFVAPRAHQADGAPKLVCFLCCPKPTTDK